MEVILCQECGTKTTKKAAKQLEAKLVCKNCYKQGSKLRKKAKQVIKEPKPEPENKPEKPKGAKKRSYSKKNHFYITREEKQVLYMKYKEKGFTHKERTEKIRKISNHMKDFVKKLREEKKSEEEIDRKFKEEFAKLIS